ncbi:MAG TPA: hypothetical protein VFB35_03915 [Gaiellaceae bacterium]|nr:hypothetical protein [Gaiellaceae bacterium]
MRIAAAFAAGAAFAGLLGGLVVLQTGGKDTGASVHRPSAAQATCASGLLRDWSDGRIDGTYPVACYRSALKSLPSDLQVYSSAPDDIAAALTQRIVQSHHPQKISGHQGAPSVRKIASAP